MNFAINTSAILAIRTEANHSSEMTSQLLFGEYCKIIEKKDDFCKIENCIDKHVGWVTQDALYELDKESVLKLQNEPIIRICVPIADVFCLTDKTVYRLPAGSLISNFDPDTNKFKLAEKIYQIHSSFISYLPEGNIDGIAPTAMAFLNTPYMAGGKNIFGIDCSGFAQIIFSINGYVLPRFSAQQSEMGKIVNNLAEAKAGDLLFFTKEDVPSHTGIYIGNNKIIHAAESVRIQEIESWGFILNEAKHHTYRLSKIKRLI